MVGEVTVIRGTDAAARWRRRVAQTPAVLPQTAADALATEIHRHLRQRDEKEAAGQPAPPTFERLYWTLFGCFLAAVGGMLSLLEPLSHRVYWLALTVGVVGAALGFYGRRYRSLRLIADAWLAGLVGVGVLAIVLLTLG